jgi:uncharacterized membrane protein
MQDINKRLDRIEERLFALEHNLSIEKPTTTQPGIPPVIQKAVVKNVEGNAAVSQQPAVPESLSSYTQPVTATRLMAWCAATTFVLAALYFLKLVYDTGWLTPLRQIGIAYFSALSLVTAGFYLERKDHQYAAYLPAVGLVVLYLTTFMAHLYYQLMAPGVATGVIGATTVFGIWLGRRFDQSVYVIFSAVGVYITPLLVHSTQSELMDLVVYYSAWSLLFSFCAIQERRRISYLLPLYLAMLGFDLVWRMSGHASSLSGEWILSASYQLVQFLIFGVTTVVYSVVHKASIDDDNALPHGLALFIFYAIEYALLQQHVPELVNYLALASGVLVYLLYVVASRLYQGEENLQQGATLVSYYCSWVAVHAIFFGEIGQHWLPWAVLCTPLIFLFMATQLEKNPKALTPITLACGALFVMGYAMLLGDILMDTRLHTPQPILASFVYMLLLYGIYYHLSRRDHPPSHAALMLYAGHLAFIACLVDWVRQDIYLSALWAVYGVALLLLAIAIKDKAIGKSALLIFAAAAIKVLLFDLSGSNSLVRVLVLLVISGSLYAGGWLYQSLVSRSPDNP